MAEISENGIYFDTKSEQIVNEPPEEGVQLLGPGMEITDAVRADIQRYRDAAAGVSHVGTIGTRGTVEAAASGDAETAADTAKPSRKARS